MSRVVKASVLGALLAGIANQRRRDRNQPNRPSLIRDVLSGAGTFGSVALVRSLFRRQ